jgi:predicted XRE-type DNA-binding protein
MREDKKKRLEAKGWRVGTVTEFLELSPEEEEYIELKLRLAAGLRRRRAERQLTQGAAAKLLKSSQSRVAKMEAGDASVSLDLLIRSLFALGASRIELARMITNKRTAGAT